MEWEKRSAYVFIKCQPGTTESAFKKLREWDTTIGVFALGGKWDLMLWMDTQDVESAYKWISEMRNWPEVDRTCTEMTYYGYRRDDRFWEQPAWSWIKVRSNQVYSVYQELKNYDCTACVGCIPGEWDCVAMLHAESWDVLYRWMRDLQTKGYEIEYHAPLDCWWNPAFEGTWKEYNTIETTTGAYS
jgi:hypothetical protein